MDKLGPEAARTGRNPDWSRDETILLLDLYLRAPRARLNHPDVIELSEFLNEVARAYGSAPLTTFRNPAGIAMKLRNLSQQDPDASALGRKGLRTGGAIDAEVWEEFAENPGRLRVEVDRIRSEWTGSPAVVHPNRSSHGPLPSFGDFKSSRPDLATRLYILEMTGPVDALLPRLPWQAGWSVFKIGRSSDTKRRIAELSCGFPPGSKVALELVMEFVLPGAEAAHRAERALLDSCDDQGWSIGGEFAFGPKDEIIEVASSIARCALAGDPM